MMHGLWHKCSVMAILLDDGFRLLSDALFFMIKNRKIFCCTVMVVMTDDGNNVEMMGLTKTQL